MSVPGYRVSQIPRFTPEQMQLFQSLFGGIGPQAGQGANLLGRFALGDQSAYDAMEQPALNTFNQKIVPGLANQFAQNGTLNSSAFNNSVAGAAGNLTADLNAQRAQLQQDALDRLLGLSNQLLGQQPYDNVLSPRHRRSFWDSLGGILGGAGSLASGLGGLGLFGGRGGSGGSRGGGGVGVNDDYLNWGANGGPFQ